MKTTIPTYIICLLVSIMSLIACSEAEQDQEQEQVLDLNSETIKISQEQFEAGGMQLVKLTKQQFTEAVYCTGTIDVPPQSRAVISAVMGGYVKSSTLLVGDKVTKGQLLLRLENPKYAELQQNYLETKAALDYLTEDYERQKTLNQENIASNKEFLKSKGDYESAAAKLKGLGEQLKMLSINPKNITPDNISTTIDLIAPIDGTLAVVNNSRGTYVDPSEPLLEIIDLNHLHLELNVYEQDFLRMKKGQIIHFSVPEASASKFLGEVHLIGNTIEEKTRTVKVHGHLESDSIPFAVGMFIEAEIVTKSSESHAIPEDAVFKSEEGEAIIRLVNSDSNQYVFERMSIQTIKAVDGLKILSEDAEIDSTSSYLLGGYHIINKGEDAAHDH